MKKISKNASVNKSVENNATKKKRVQTITERVRLYLKTKHVEEKKVLQIIEMCNEYLDELKCAKREIIEQEINNLYAELDKINAA